MIPPKPSFKKCFKCGKTFVYAPKSDALTYKDSLCKKCGGRKKGIIEDIMDNISAITNKLKESNR